MSIFTKDFVNASIERAIKTGCQTLTALLGAGAVGIIDAPWLDSLSVAGMAAVLSLLTSVGSDAATKGGPSLTNSEVLPTDVPGQHAA